MKEKECFWCGGTGKERYMFITDLVVTTSNNFVPNIRGGEVKMAEIDCICRLNKQVKQQTI